MILAAFLIVRDQKYPAFKVSRRLKILYYFIRCLDCPREENCLNGCDGCDNSICLQDIRVEIPGNGDIIGSTNGKSNAFLGDVLN